MKSNVDNSQNKLRVLYIESGSKGNATIVESDTDAVLIDCGITKKSFENAVAKHGFDIAKIRGVLITHTHSDHVKGIGVVLRHLQKKLDVMPKMHIDQESFEKCSGVRDHRTDTRIEFLDSNGTVSFGNLQVRSFPTSHDAYSPRGFTISLVEEGDCKDKYGHITDTGFVTPEAFAACEGCRILGLESNHDVKMLKNGPYPYHLKVRVGSDHGHLSNDQAAEALSQMLHPALESVVALHLSENNNYPDLAVNALKKALAGDYEHVQVYHAYQGMPLLVE